MSRELDNTPAIHSLAHSQTGAAHTDHDGIAPNDGDMMRYDSVLGKWVCVPPSNHGAHGANSETHIPLVLSATAITI